jgi:hypothetical protein
VRRTAEFGGLRAKAVTNEKEKRQIEVMPNISILIRGIHLIHEVLRGLDVEVTRHIERTNRGCRTEAGRGEKGMKRRSKIVRVTHFKWILSARNTVLKRSVRQRG